MLSCCFLCSASTKRSLSFYLTTGIARLHWKMGQAELAEKSYKNGLYYNPQNPYLLQSWAVQLVKQGKLKQAMTLLTTAVKKNPGHAASWVEMAKLHQRSGDVSSARYCFSQAVSCLLPPTLSILSIMLFVVNNYFHFSGVVCAVDGS